MHSSGTKQCFINNLKRTSVFCVNLYNLQRGLVNRMHAWVFSFPLEDERSRPRETRACVILFRIHSGNYHIISFICHLFNELQKHEWKILFLWMSVFFLVWVFFLASTYFARFKNIKGTMFCSSQHAQYLFRFDVFPFLIIFKTGFSSQNVSGYWNLITRLNIFQNRTIKPNIPGLQDPTNQQPNPPNQIEQETGDEEIQLEVTAKMCIDSDPTSISFIV